MIDMSERFSEEQQCRILIFPEDLLYSDTHEWVGENGSEMTFGLAGYVVKASLGIFPR